MAREETGRIDEADWISERIVHVERAFAPWTARDLTHRQAAIAHFGREASHFLGASKRCFEVVDCEIHVIEIRSRRAIVTSAAWAVNREDYPAAHEVVAPARDPHPWLLEQCCVE